MAERTKIYVLIVTEECNLNCAYCYAKKGRRRMNKKTALAVCRFIKNDVKKNKISDVQIVFGGNEPLLNLSIIKLIANTLRREIRRDENEFLGFVLFSNLWQMNDSKLRWIKEADMPIYTSLDGPEDLHDLHRGKGSFGKAVFWMDKMKKNKIPFSAAAVITRFSLARYEDIADAYVKQGLNTLNLRYLLPIEKGKFNRRKLGYSPEQFSKFRENISDYLIRINESGQNLADGKFLFMFRRIKGGMKKSDDFSPPCNAIEKQICFDPAGDIYTCDEGRWQPEIFKIGDAERGINEEKKKHFFSLIKQATRKNCLKKKCPIRKLCGPCLAINEQAAVCAPSYCSAWKNETAFFRAKLKDKKISAIAEHWLENRDS